MTKYPHRITVWRKTAVDRYGVPTWEGPFYVNTRWEDKQTLYLNLEGREVRGDSNIYVEEDIVRIGDHVSLGVFTGSTPNDVSKEVRNRRAISNLRGTRTEVRVIV